MGLWVVFEVVLWLTSRNHCLAAARSLSAESWMEPRVEDLLRGSGEAGGLGKSWLKVLAVGDVSGEASGVEAPDESCHKSINFTDH